ncbi:uncharacterized protein LOC117208700 [Bombus bifarius]|uniref:Uncharacterized protein LOC117208700 n=1 Tax=Bombus bifarius TaxID=103933 RepID=A0A6P8MTK8_9HYME|nr:uncharacterized protein LOC117208700 [Bombus bifarius]
MTQGHHRFIIVSKNIKPRSPNTTKQELSSQESAMQLISADRNVIMEGATIQYGTNCWAFSFDRGSVISKSNSEDHYHNMAPNASHRKRRLYSRRSSALQAVLQNGYTNRNSILSRVQQQQGICHPMDSYFY